MHSGCIVRLNTPPGTLADEVVELLAPDAEDLLRVGESLEHPGDRLELREVVQGPADRQLDEAGRLTEDVRVLGAPPVAGAQVVRDEVAAPCSSSRR